MLNLQLPGYQQQWKHLDWAWAPKCMQHSQSVWNLNTAGWAAAKESGLYFQVGPMKP